MKTLFSMFIPPVAVFVVDQGIKIVVQSSGLFVLNASWFGFVSSVWVSGGVTLCLLAFVFYFWNKSHFAFYYGIMFAGGLSNSVDRFLYGGVVDYVFVKSFAFNIADAAIWIGCVLALIHHVRVHRPLKRLEH